MGRSLITGGSGFLGINLAKKLLNKKEDIVIYDINPLPHELEGQAEFYKGDIRDQKGLEKAMKNVDTVYHTVALVPVSDAGKAFWEINVYGTEIAGKAALESGVKKFIHVSSSSVYDLDAKMPLTEESPIKEHGDYEITKYQSELKILHLVEKGLPAAIIRPRTIIGPCRGGIFQILFEWIMKGKRVFIIGNGNNLYQMLSASDLCDACIAAAKTAKSNGEIFNIGAAKYGTLKEDLEKLIEHSGTQAKLQPVPPLAAKIPLSILYHSGFSPFVPWHYNTMYKPFYLDISKAKKILGWKPIDSNEKMLTESYDWYAGHHKEITVGTFHTQAPDQKLVKWIRKLI